MRKYTPDYYFEPYNYYERLIKLEGNVIDMSQFRRVRTELWKHPIISEEMTAEDKYLMLYLLTNPQSTHNGRYKISEEQIAHDMGYSIESIHSLLDRMIHHHQIIRYNPETKEIVVDGWDKGTGTVSQSVAENMT